MKEELIRVRNGYFLWKGHTCQFDLDISRGECIGVYVDNHDSSGTAYIDILRGNTHLQTGHAYLYGNGVSAITLERWINRHCMMIGRYRFVSKELTMRDYVLVLGKTENGYRRKEAARLQQPEVQEMLGKMDLRFSWDTRLNRLSLSDYYCLAVFRAWFWKVELLALDRLTEILSQLELDRLMRCVQHLLQQGSAVLLFDMQENFMYQHANRVDVIKNNKTHFRLYPEEYDDRLYEILGWERRSHPVAYAETQYGQKSVLQVSDLSFSSLPPLNFQICSGEIALLRDDNHRAVSQLRGCFLQQQSWQRGTFVLDGASYSYGDMQRLIGTKIGVQMEYPDRASGVLFGNLTALDNLTLCLLPKAGRYVLRKRLVERILQEASSWFPREALLRPLREWSLPERLRFSYYKWYCINPSLLVCFFPFTGQESAHHEMVIDMLVACAQRGMAVWVISSGIDAICEKTHNQEFLHRLRDIGRAGALNAPFSFSVG